MTGALVLRRWLSGSTAAAVVLAATVVCACLIGTSATVSVGQAAESSRNQVADVLVTTAGSDPVTIVAGVPHLAPDAWMTPGQITREQVSQLAILPGVEIAAPLAVLPMQRRLTGESAALWLSQTSGSDFSWTSLVTASVKDGSGSRALDPRTMRASFVDQQASLSGVEQLFLPHDLTSYPGPVELIDGAYRAAHSHESRVMATALLLPSRAHVVGIDPTAEAQLATAAKATSLSEDLDTLTSRSAAAVSEESIPSSWGEPLPALQSAGELPAIAVSSTTQVRQPVALTGEARDKPCDEWTWYPENGTCYQLSQAGDTLLDTAPVTATWENTVTSPTLTWRHYLHPVTPPGDEPAPSLPRYAGQGLVAAEREAPAPLVREAGTDGTVTVSPASSPVSFGPGWHDETYRPMADLGVDVPALGLVVGDTRDAPPDADTYLPTTGAFLPGTSPFEASTLRTEQGRVLQTFDGTGAATSAAPAVVDLEQVWQVVDEHAASAARAQAAIADALADSNGSQTRQSSDTSDTAAAAYSALGANAVRLRLERAGDGPASDDLLSRVVAEVTRMGLVATVLDGASPVTVNVSLEGSDPVAWHGQAVEEWAELGADVRVESAAGWVVLVLPLLAVTCVAGLVVLVERAGSRRRVTAGRVLAGCGWTSRRVRARLVAAVAPGVAVVIAACLAGGAASWWRGAAGVNTVVVLSAGLLYILGVPALALWDARRALAPTRTAPPRLPRADGPAQAQSRAAGTTGGVARVQSPDAAEPDASDSLVSARPDHRRTRSLTGRIRRPRTSPQRIRPHRLRAGTWGVGAGSASPGHLALVAGCVLAGAVTAAGVQVLRSGGQAAGSSQLAHQGISIVRLASLGLLAATAVAVVAVLVPGLATQRATSRARAQVLAMAGWGRARRVRVEVAAWTRRYLVPVAVCALAAAAAALAASLFLAHRAAAGPADVPGAVPPASTATGTGRPSLVTTLLNAAGQWLALAGLGAATALAVCVLIGGVGLVSCLGATRPRRVPAPAPRRPAADTGGASSPTHTPGDGSAVVPPTAGTATASAATKASTATGPTDAAHEEDA